MLFGLVFITRYLDLATNFVSVYNTVMKVVFLLSILATCYLIFFKFRATYDSNHDAFRAEFLVIPTAGLAVLVNHEFSVLEVCVFQRPSLGIEPLTPSHTDSVDILYLPGVSGHNAPAVHDLQDRRGRDHNLALSLCPGVVPRTLHRELGLPVLHRGFL